MSFLHKLWDETLAGPAPDSGLGRLRKYNSFSATRSPPMMLSDDMVSKNNNNNNNNNIQIPISSTHDLISAPSTPTTPPPTPPETPRGEDCGKRLTRRRSIDYPRPRPRPRPLDQPTPTTPSVYDWIVITALDR